MLKQSLHIIRNMGWRYTLYRLRHEIEKRTGILAKRHPIHLPQKKIISLKTWKKNTPAFVIPEKEKLFIAKQPNAQLKLDAEHILSGKIKFFSHEWKELGDDYDWVTNPDSGYQYNIDLHWSKIADYSAAAGDIKYVWEKSRFSWLLTLIRNDYHHNEDHSEFVFSEIESWIDANPVNQGPNWRCSQEISLRIFNWLFALHFYKNSSAFTERRWQKIQQTLYWSLHHVYNHIDFSRIAVRNNHAITETLFLALSNLLFPFIPETKKWADDGRKWFEEEIAYQIYEDGTYLQYSMNYHRVVVQLLSLGIAISEIHQKPFQKIVYERAYKSTDFLYQCLQHENGYLPNSGANDGAWFFPLSQTDYRDYRPQLNTLHVLLTGEKLFDSNIINEDAEWIVFSSKSKNYLYRTIAQTQGIRQFPIGGYYLIRENQTFTFIRCSNYKNRPSHADNLHIDIWHKGNNILCDAGSYKYNTENSIIKYFSGTESHNTVMLENYDQMLKGSRFIWLNWTQLVHAEIKETNSEYVFAGKIKCFSYLNKQIMHQRIVIKNKDKNEWIVKDEIAHKPNGLKMRQLWHTTKDDVNFTSTEENQLVKKEWNSLYYGEKKETTQVEYVSTINRIETKITV